ncbi:MAG: tyrosine-type recombinase/integrase [Patescibacteria group bacterium]|nr:tyrosine-type recombinase/integrase [Patescibacteria group bacterium]MDE2015188.1 tyrosine-type recombinase/integrase [Patescibacteria group bacterium]MDE2226616.1 tyrosine-type recombinase/integrase [Patescibacteria group bacterium]
MSDIEKFLNDYLAYLEIEKNRSPKTRENYERYLAEFLKFARIKSPKEITENIVREFRLNLARSDRKKITQNYYIIALRNFLKYLAKRDVKVLSPEKIELPKIPERQIEILEYGDLERLLAAPRGGGLRSLRDKAILEVFFSTGLRLSELCNLSRYIDLKRGELSVRGKGDKLRVVFLSDSAREAMQKYIAKRTDTEESLFISLTKAGKGMGKITQRSVQRMIESRAKEAGIQKKIHPHQLRHSFATDLLVNGADLRSVQELLGHANIATTQVYTHLTNKELREIHKTFHARRRS